MSFFFGVLSYELIGCNIPEKVGHPRSRYSIALRLEGFGCRVRIKRGNIMCRDDIPEIPKP